MSGFAVPQGWEEGSPARRQNSGAGRGFLIRLGGGSSNRPFGVGTVYLLRTQFHYARPSHFPPLPAPGRSQGGVKGNE